MQYKNGSFLLFRKLTIVLVTDNHLFVKTDLDLA